MPCQADLDIRAMSAGISVKSLGHLPEDISKFMTRLGYYYKYFRSALLSVSLSLFFTTSATPNGAYLTRQVSFENFPACQRDTEYQLRTQTPLSTHRNNIPFARSHFERTGPPPAKHNIKMAECSEIGNPLVADQAGDEDSVVVRNDESDME